MARLWECTPPSPSAGERSLDGDEARFTSCPACVTGLFNESVMPASDDVPLAVILAAPSRALLPRLFAWLSLPLRARMAERLIARAGGVPCGRYGVFPSAEAPVISYELRTTAARYAEARLLTANDHSIIARIRSLASRFVGCDPAVDTVVIVGRRAGTVSERR
jgi:hypothetical protein